MALEALWNLRVLDVSAMPHESYFSRIQLVIHRSSNLRRLTENGCIPANQRISAVGEFLGTFAGIKGTPGIEGTRSTSDKRLKQKEVVV